MPNLFINLDNKSNKINKASDTYKQLANNISNNYIKVQKSIIFQIEILKNQIQRNNHIHQEYNKIFTQNINYKYNQKNTFNNRINAANDSITNEINTLSQMYNIINNHPYNYLIIFQSKNYIIPYINLRENIKSITSFNNIKTSNYFINKNNVTINTVSYKSEEATVGISTFSSIITSSKVLLFSKINFAYDRIYYYSKKTNNLKNMSSNFNLINNENKKTNSLNINKFIINKDKNNYKKYSYEVTKYSNHFGETKNPSNFIKKDNNSLYIVAGGIVLSATIIGIGISAYLIYKKLMRNKNKYNSRQVISYKNSDDYLEMNGRGIMVEESTFEETKFVIERVFDKIRKRQFSDKSFDQDNPGINSETEMFISNIYKRKKISEFETSLDEFRLQLIVFARNKVRSDAVKSVNINDYICQELLKLRLRNNMNPSVVRAKKQKLYEYYNLVQNITNSSRKKAKYANHAELTNNGWFNMPVFEDLTSKALKDQEIMFLEDQLEKFNTMIDAIPITNEKSTDILSHETLGIQILGDLKQLHLEYYNALRMIQLPEVTTQQRKCVMNNGGFENARIRNFFKEFTNTRLNISNYGDLEHFGINDNDLSFHLNNIARLVE